MKRTLLTESTSKAVAERLKYGWAGENYCGYRTDLFNGHGYLRYCGSGSGSGRGRGTQYGRGTGAGHRDQWEVLS